MKILILTVILLNIFIFNVGYLAAFDDLGLWLSIFFVLIIGVSFLLLFFWPVLVAFTVTLGVASFLGKKIIPIVTVIFLSLFGSVPSWFLGRYLHILFKAPDVGCILYIFVCLLYYYFIYKSIKHHLKQI